MASSLTRIFVSSGLSSGAVIPLDASAAHKINVVLRARVGASVAAFNSADGEFACTLETRGTRLRVHARTREPPSAIALRRAPLLIYCPLRVERSRFLIEKATELGVRGMLPLLTARTQHAASSKSGEWARGAAEQCGRLDVPLVHAAVRLDHFLSAWSSTAQTTAQTAPWLDERPTRLLVGDANAGTRLSAVLPSINSDSVVAVAVGPEGGWTSDEIAAFDACDGASRVALGLPSVLRAETAGLAFLVRLAAAREC
jgi:16S rRNA (uracil1498-N3)-methyltransferase